MQPNLERQRETTVALPEVRPVAVMFDDDPNVEVNDIEPLLATFGMDLDLRIGFGSFSDFWDDSLSNVWVPQLLLLDLQLEGTPNLAALGRPEVKIPNEQEAGIVVAHTIVMENTMYEAVPIMFVTNYPNVSSIQAHKDRRNRHKQIASARKSNFELDASTPFERWFVKPSSANNRPPESQLSPEEYEELWRGVCKGFELGDHEQLSALGLQDSDAMDVLTAIAQRQEVKDRIDSIVNIGFYANVLTTNKQAWKELINNRDVTGKNLTISETVRSGSLTALREIKIKLEALIDGTLTDI